MSVPKRSAQTIRTLGDTATPGLLIELLAPEAGNLRPNVLLWNGIRAKIGPGVKFAGRVYESDPIPEQIVKSIYLPTGERSYGTTAELFESAANLFANFMGLPTETAQLATFFSFSSWFSDLIPTTPSLLITGPDSDYAMNLLRLLTDYTGDVVSQPVELRVCNDSVIRPAGIRAPETTALLGRDLTGGLCHPSLDFRRYPNF